MRRHALGLIAFLSLLGGCIGLYYVGVNDSQSSMFASIAIRAGLVMGAIWLALPQLSRLQTRIPPWLIVLLLLGGVVTIARPRLILFVGPLLVLAILVQFIGWLFKPLPPPKRRKPNKDQPQESQRS
jgi:hypothetical protein